MFFLNNHLEFVYFLLQYQHSLFHYQNNHIISNDIISWESIKEKIVTIAKDFHLTTIIVTHDPEEALTISDKVLIINKGNIEQFGTPDEIINSPASDFVNDFILKQLTIKKNNIFKLFDEKRNGNAQQAD